MTKETRTYRERAEYLKVAVARRRKVLKIRAVKVKGGKCAACGYQRCIAALEFHHVGDDKDFGVSFRGFSRSWKRIRSELGKCILLCANCHRELHSGLLQLPGENQGCKPGELRET